MFNSEQREYIKYLSEQEPKDLCYCGWYKLRKCPDCPPEFTNEDKMKTLCKYCFSSAISPNTKTIHKSDCKYYNKV